MPFHLPSHFPLPGSGRHARATWQVPRAPVLPANGKSKSAPFIRRILILAPCLALLATSCKRSEPTTVKADPDPVALEIGDRKIRLSELQAELDLLRERRSPAANSLDAFLEPNIDRLVALEEARRLGLDQDPAIRRQHENLLIGRLRESQIEAKIRETTVTDEEIQAHFDANLATYSRPAQVRLALLFLATPSRATDEARATIRARLEEARTLAADLPADTRGFGAHAMTYSEEATSRFKGGDIGWLEAGASAYRWPDAVVKAGFTLQEKGDLSDIIDTDDGYYLLMKLDSREAVIRSLDGRLRSTLEAQLIKGKRVSAEASLMQDWNNAHPVTTHPEVLKSLRFQVSPESAEATGPVPTNP